MVDTSKPRIGDVVTVRATVLDVDGHEVHLQFKRAPGYSTGGIIDAYVDPWEILSIEPRPIEVGDRAFWRGASAKVLAIHEREAWIEYETKPSPNFGITTLDNTVVPLSELTREEPSNG